MGQLEQLVQDRGWAPPAQDILRLNIGMSHKVGSLPFKDPGNEGGKLILGVIEKASSSSSNSSSSSSSSGSSSRNNSSNNNQKKMTLSEFETATRCTYTSTKEQEMDPNRITIVPTYTMDLLVSSLESLGKISPVDEI